MAIGARVRWTRLNRRCHGQAEDARASWLQRLRLLQRYVLHVWLQLDAAVDLPQRGAVLVYLRRFCSVRVLRLVRMGKQSLHLLRIRQGPVLMGGTRPAILLTVAGVAGILGGFLANRDAPGPSLIFAILVLTALHAAIAQQTLP
jgi:hypothetical protein